MSVTEHECACGQKIYFHDFDEAVECFFCKKRYRQTITLTEVPKDVSYAEECRIMRTLMGVDNE